MNKKVYIGDSVYAEIQPAPFIGFELVLTTENGYPDDPRNRIVLGGSEWSSLLMFVENFRDRNKQEDEP